MRLTSRTHLLRARRLGRAVLHWAAAPLRGALAIALLIALRAH